MPPTGKIGTSAEITDRSALTCAGENVSAGRKFQSVRATAHRHERLSVANPGNEIMPQFTAW